MTVAELSRILSGVSLSAFAQIALKVGMASPRGQQLLQSPVAQMPVQKVKLHSLIRPTATAVFLLNRCSASCQTHNSRF